MKNIYLIIIFLIFFSCKKGLKNDNGVVFDIKKIEGKYKVDIEEFIDSDFETDKKNNSNNNFINSIIKNINMELNFEKNNKGVYIVNFGVLNIFFDSENLKRDFNYDLLQDSIIIVKFEDNTERKFMIKKFSDDFKYIQLKEENIIFSIQKIF